MHPDLIRSLRVGTLVLCASVGAGAQTATTVAPAIQFPAAGSGTISGNSTTGINASAPRASISEGDRVFMTKAAGGGLYEVEVSKLAEQKASDQGVKEMASMLVKDHSAANSELMQLASSKGVTLPDKMPADKQAVIKKLSGRSGASFDTEYMRMVGISDHQKDIRLFENGSRNAKDPELKAWIDKTLPTLRAHLSHAKGMKISNTSKAKS